MILPPLPQGYENKPWDYKGPIWTESQMKVYGEACIKQVCGGRHRGPKFSPKDVALIRELHAQGFSYKAVNRQIEMSEPTFYNVVHHKGAYK